MSRHGADSIALSVEQKIVGRHLDRLAVVYVRQSTVHQVQQHQESTQLQYGLVDRAIRLGWPRASGKSCCATATRPTSPGTGTRRTSPASPRIARARRREARSVADGRC